MSLWSPYFMSEQTNILMVCAANSLHFLRILKKKLCDWLEQKSNSDLFLLFSFIYWSYFCVLRVEHNYPSVGVSEPGQGVSCLTLQICWSLSKETLLLPSSHMWPHWHNTSWLCWGPAGARHTGLQPASQSPVSTQPGPDSRTSHVGEQEEGAGGGCRSL